MNACTFEGGSIEIALRQGITIFARCLRKLLSKRRTHFVGAARIISGLQLSQRLWRCIGCLSEMHCQKICRDNRWFFQAGALAAQTGRSQSLQQGIENLGVAHGVLFPVCSAKRFKIKASTACQRHSSDSRYSQSKCESCVFSTDYARAKLHSHWLEIAIKRQL